MATVIADGGCACPYGGICGRSTAGTHCYFKLGPTESARLAAMWSPSTHFCIGALTTLLLIVVVVGCVYKRHTIAGYMRSACNHVASRTGGQDQKTAEAAEQGENKKAAIDYLHDKEVDTGSIKEASKKDSEYNGAEVCTP